MPNFNFPNPLTIPTTAGNFNQSIDSIADYARQQQAVMQKNQNDFGKQLLQYKLQNILYPNTQFALSPEADQNLDNLIRSNPYVRGLVPPPMQGMAQSGGQPSTPVSTSNPQNLPTVQSNPYGVPVNWSGGQPSIAPLGGSMSPMNQIGGSSVVTGQTFERNTPLGKTSIPTQNPINEGIVAATKASMSKQAETQVGFQQEAQEALKNLNLSAGITQNADKAYAAALQSNAAGNKPKQVMSQLANWYGGQPGEDKSDYLRVVNNNRDMVFANAPILTQSKRFLQSVQEALGETYLQGNESGLTAMKKLQQDMLNMYRITRAQYQLGYTPEQVKNLENSGDISGLNSMATNLVKTANSYQMSPEEVKGVDNYLMQATPNLNKYSKTGHSILADDYPEVFKQENQISKGGSQNPIMNQGHGSQQGNLKTRYKAGDTRNIGGVSYTRDANGNWNPQ